MVAERARALNVLRNEERVKQEGGGLRARRIHRPTAGTEIMGVYTVTNTVSRPTIKIKLLTTYRSYLQVRLHSIQRLISRPGVTARIIIEQEIARQRDCQILPMDLSKDT